MESLWVYPGTNLIADPLYQADPDFSSFAPNTLQTLLVLSGSTFNGVTVEEWNGANLNSYTNNGSSWYLNGNENGDAPIYPGQAVIIRATNQFTLTFEGLVRDGAEVNGTNYITNYIKAPTNYLASILPMAGPVQHGLGCPASVGDEVQICNPTNHSQFLTYTNTATGWSPSEPTLGLGQGFILITTNVNNVWVQTNMPCY
jgi:hypothetical protein